MPTRETRRVREAYFKYSQVATLRNALQSLIGVMKARDPLTERHMQRVGALLLNLTRALGVPETAGQMIVLAGWLHDVGKYALPKALLSKPGRLTEEEWAIMRTHSTLGAEMIGQFPPLRPLAPLIRAHHERWDGQGYPDSLRGEEIPFGARLIAVADAYTVMMESRPYQCARSQCWALAELRRCAGSQFDPLLARAVACVLETADKNLFFRLARPRVFFAGSIEYLAGATRQILYGPILKHAAGATFREF